jgi:hypothetical protein
MYQVTVLPRFDSVYGRFIFPVYNGQEYNISCIFDNGPRVPDLLEKGAPLPEGYVKKHSETSVIVHHHGGIIGPGMNTGNE